MSEDTSKKYYHTCKKMLKSLGLLTADMEELIRITPDEFPFFLGKNQKKMDFPPYLLDVAHLEKQIFYLQKTEFHPALNKKNLSLNPTLDVLASKWQGLLSFIEQEGKAPEPKPGNEFILTYIHPLSKKIISATATDNDLLSLKIIGEELELKTVARENNVAIGLLDRALEIGVYKGFIISPPSSIQRPDTLFSDVAAPLKEFQKCEVFTLQWHITQACDLHCKHCYDRSSRDSIEYEKAIDILDQMREFCLGRFVSGQISFTGGNPLLHPRFTDLYQEAAKRNLGIAILGNPTTKEKLQELAAIQMPAFYQVSLEGLEQHNDLIRGQGHFNRTINFLEVLKESGIYSMVMLTLTQENLDQVLALAEKLRDKCDLFTFNRLSTVGEGAQLKSASCKNYFDFLEAYLEAARHNPVMALKDNLFNIVKHAKGEKLFGGCAGFGCGAAFNFVSLLPDGEVHACRKLPSLIGNINKDSLNQIYDSIMAQKYRKGPESCNNCQLRVVCGGCLAVIQGAGLNVFHDRDPYCSLEEVI